MDAIRNVLSGNRKEETRAPFSALNPTPRKVLMIAGDFVEDYEVMVPFQILQMVGHTVHAVSPGKKDGDKIKTAVHDFRGDQTYEETRGHDFAINFNFDRVKAEEYDALYIPGGRAPEYLRLNADVIKIVQHFFQANKPVAVICHGAQILTAADVLKGRKLTAYSTLEPEVKISGGNWQTCSLESVVVDGNLVTAVAWTAHAAFMREFLRLIERGGEFVWGGNAEGKKLPQVTFRTRVRDPTIEGTNPFKWQDRTTDDLFKNKKIVVLALPGAFTPTCSSTHLPGYDAKYDEFKALGIDEVICLSVNDAFVMYQWGKNLGLKNVFLLPDGNGEFTKALGMLVTKSNLGFGLRSWRYSMYVEDGQIKKMFQEPGFADDFGEDPFEQSDADTMLNYLKSKGN